METLFKNIKEISQLKEDAKKANEGFDLIQDHDGIWHISTINFQYPRVSIHFFGMCGYQRVLLSQHHKKAFYTFQDDLPGDNIWKMCEGCWMIADLFFHQHRPGELWVPADNIVKFKPVDKGGRITP